MKALDIPRFLAISMTLLVAFMIVMGYFYPQSENSNLQSQVMIAWASVVSFYFGSSQSSARKTEMLMAPTTSTVTTTPDATVRTVTEPSAQKDGE